MMMREDRDTRQQKYKSDKEKKKHYKLGTGKLLEEWEKTKASTVTQRLKPITAWTECYELG